MIFSLAGDVLLMLPRERFLGGLVAFLAAHLAYIAGFNTTPPPLNLVTLLFMALVSICAAWVYRRVALGLRTGGHSQLQAPVAAYVVAIGLMVLSALLTLTRPEWAPSHALLASLGAVLFFVSDGLLAWNRFVSPIPHGRLLVIVTYHLGQIIMVAGVTLNALR